MPFAGHSGVRSRDEGELTNALTQLFRTLFKDPQFQVTGATPAAQIQSLTTAVQKLNFGQQQALYKNLGGTK